MNLVETYRGFRNQSTFHMGLAKRFNENFITYLHTYKHILIYLDKKYYKIVYVCIYECTYSSLTTEIHPVYVYLNRQFVISFFNYNIFMNTQEIE